MTLFEKDIVVIGGGQAGLSMGWHLLRSQRDFVVLDDGTLPGGAWRHGWDSLRLFSPAAYSSLPGWQMPPPGHYGFPTRDDVIAYLAAYETRYDFPVERPVQVSQLHKADDGRLRVETDRGSWLAKTVIGATGTWSHPFIPDIPGRSSFAGIQLHSAHYVRPDVFAGKTVLVVGGGNSGAQIHAEISQVAHSNWVTQSPPVFLPDDVDGRALFERATAMHRGEAIAGPALGFANIVMVPPVREARDRGALANVRPFIQMTPNGVVWPEAAETKVDAIIWCTGFRAALGFLGDLGFVGDDGRVAVNALGQAEAEPRLWLHGYGDWTGFASATLIGSGRRARAIVRAIVASDAAQAASTAFR
ncbi:MULTISPECIES: ArsO family NAD(P)H-dependent flavin-containing monooxygenase [Sphingobium]|nr:ArsO family NAD(P)H-dependent flavin-containing monooxygenase [Sphingobium psychrophilum]